MKPSSEIVLKGLLNRCSESKRGHLLKYLSEAHLDMLREIPLPNITFSSKDFSYMHLLDIVHYSWLIPSLKLYEKSDQVLLVQTLDSQSRNRLMKFLELPKKEIPLTSKCTLYFKQILIHSLLEKNQILLPIEYLPESRLNMLLNLSKSQLIDLIDFLSLYDLASALHQVLETKTLKKIYKHLKPAQKKFLKRKLTYKEISSFPQLNLKNWDGEKTSLKKMLHKQGIFRLSQALSVEHEDLIWYIYHELDIGRGNLLHQLTQKQTSLNVADKISNQILEILDLLEEANP